MDALLRCDDEAQTEEIANFNGDTENIERNRRKNTTLWWFQSAKNQADKVFRVNVISGGDPLEIYTDREGEVIFKKYSPIGELSAFAGQYAETLHKTCGLCVAICDRDSVIACAGIPRKEYSDKALSEALEGILEGRSLYHYAEGQERKPLVRDSDSHYIHCAMPILSEGDIVGCVVSAAQAEEGAGDRASVSPDVEAKLIQTAAGFLGRQLEA